MNPFVNKIIFLFVFTTLCLLGLWIGIKSFFFLLPFLIAYLIAKPLNRLCRFIRRKLPIPYPIIVGAVVIVFIAVLFGGISYGIYRGFLATSHLSGQLTAASTAVTEFAQNTNAIEINLPWNDGPIYAADLIVQFYDVIFNAISEFSNYVLNKAISILKAVPSASLFVFFLFLSLYFITKDREAIVAWVEKTVNRIESPVFHKIKVHAFGAIKSYVKAILILVTITFFISLIGLLVLGIPYAPLIALMVAFVDFIPLVGPAIVFIPWVIFLLMASEFKLAVALLVVYLATTLTRQILEPKIISTKIGANPLVTIISMYTCYRIIGVLGLILGPILVMLVMIVLEGYRLATENEI
ncbi:AI-2E family transporter [Fusibacter sp. JL298sf-3]